MTQGTVCKINNPFPCPLAVENRVGNAKNGLGIIGESVEKPVINKECLMVRRVCKHQMEERISHIGGAHMVKKPREIAKYISVEGLRQGR
jgi:hypothetical protein